MRAIVRVNMHLSAKCPHCQEHVNILKSEKNDYEGRITKNVIAGKTDQVAGMAVECPDCNKKFEIDFLVY